MILTLLNKQTLQLINRKQLKYSLVAAEKDYFLAMALKILEESPLFSTLVFKGGTAIHHCYLPQSRFSEDLDFTSLDKDLKSEAVTALFKPHSFFEVKKLYTSQATIKIERLKYSGVLDQPNSLKFEVDFLQNWQVVSEKRHDEIDLIYYHYDVFNKPQWIEDMVGKLQFETIDPRE